MAERRDEILDIAKQMFARQGISETTVRQIGAEAGVLSGSLYHHFASKLDMVDAILQDFCERLTTSYRAVATSGGSAHDRLRGLVRQGIGFVDEDRAAVIMFQRESDTLASDDRFTYLRETEKEAEKLWVSVLEGGQASGDFRDDFDVRLTYRVLRDVVASSARWHRPVGQEGGNVADAIVDIVLQGIAER